MKPVDPRTTAGRAFVRSLNILLKFARLYGFEHSRTVEQFDTAWRELHAAIPAGAEQGLLLAATGSQLLLDGVPIEGSPAEKQFAQLLAAAGLGSVQFFPAVTQEDLNRFARAFPTGKSKPTELAQQLKTALAGTHGIRINEICFVATDSRMKDAGMAAQLAAVTLGGDADLKRWMNDPQKLLEMIAAAQGSQGGGSAAGSGDGPGGSGTGSGSGAGAGSGAGTGTGSGSGTGSGAAGSGTGEGGGSRSGSGASGSGGSSRGSGSGEAGPGFGLGLGPGLGPGRGAAEPSEAEIYRILGALAGFGQAGATGGAVAAGGHGIGGATGIGLGGSGGPGAGGGGGTAVSASGGGLGSTAGAVGGSGGSGSVGASGTGTGVSGSSGGGGTGTATGTGTPGAPFHESLSQLPIHAQDILKQALTELAAKAPGAKPDQSVLVQLAEHLAIRFALERFERGEVKVNAVRQMLDRMNQEIENLRKILGAQEDKMSDAGLLVESHRDVLDRQFWAAVPESGKRAVLLSDDAWCIPPRNVQSYVSELVKKGSVAEAVSILQNYASCAGSEDADARKKTATGLAQLAELYAKVDPKLLGEALRHLGLRLNVEQDSDLQTLVSAAFVRFCQEAATTRCYPVMEQALDLVSGVEAQRPGVARNLRAKMGIEDRVPEFLEEALRARRASAGLTRVLKLLPQTSMELLSARFSRCSLREDAEQVANLAADLGEEGLQHLRSTVRSGPVAEAVEMVGLLSRLDPQAVQVFLPPRVKDFPRASQDRVVRQLSAGGAHGRCRILLELLDHVDPLVMPLVIDEIGVTSDREALGRLMNIVDGDLPAGAGPFLRVKAAEALGRIQTPESAAGLKRIVEAKKIFGWAHPQELRIAALQALEKLDPAWARDFLPKSGLDQAELILAPLTIAANCRFVRQRRHARVRLQKPVIAVTVNLKENCRMEIRTASLSGGVANIDRHLPPGTPVQLKLQLGMRNLQATALMRDYRAQGMAFEIVDMSLEERNKLRHLLADSLSVAAASEEVETPVPSSVPVAH